MAEHEPETDAGERQQTPAAPARNVGHRWRKGGKSPNPKGRPKGSKNRPKELTAVAGEPKRLTRQQKQTLAWTKGMDSPNPAGRPKGVGIWSRVRAKLLEKIAAGPQAGKEYADLAADAIVKAIIMGKWPQTKELLDREEGPIPDKVEMQHSGKIDHTVRPLMEKILSTPEGLNAARTIVDQRSRITADRADENGNGHHDGTDDAGDADDARG